MTSISSTLRSESLTSSLGDTGEEGPDADCQEYLDDYETQYFGFTPQSFMNGLYNAVIEYLNEVMSKFDEHILTELSDLMPEEKVKAASGKLLSQMVQKLDKYFDRFEEYLLTNVFKIPHHVLLPEDKVHREEPTAVEDNEILDKNIAELRIKIMAVKYANSKLQHQLKDVETTQEEFDKFLQQLKKLKAVIAGAGVSDMKGSLQHTAENLTKLVDIIEGMQSASGS